MTITKALSFITRVAPVLLICAILFTGRFCFANESSTIDVDYRALVSHADLVYFSPAEVPAEGMPIGNGIMGTLVWTTPSAVNFQINREDVYAGSKDHRGYFFGETDYFGACAQVTVDVGGAPFDPMNTFRQHLSLYDAENRVAGKDVHVRCFVSSARDVLVLELDDQRAQPQELRVTVSMWSAPEVKTELRLWPLKEHVIGTHLVRYQFPERDERVLVVRQFRDADYHCASALAAQVVGDSVTVETSSQRARTIVAPAKRGKRIVLITSAASRLPADDVGSEAVQLLDEAAKRSYDALRKEHTRWWHEFWSRTFVVASSDDGLADFIARARTLHLYYMGSTSRGQLPTKWNGMLFGVNGDFRWWGMQIWVWTTEMLYWPLHAADAIDLADSLFQMYVRQLPAAKKAAEQRWGVQGAFYGETSHPDGPVVLTDEAAREYQDVLLERKLKNTLSLSTRIQCQHDSQLFVTARFEDPYSGEPNDGGEDAKPYAPIGHVVSSGCEIAHQAWWRYRYSGDKQWLRDYGYPLLRENVEFYRTFVKKGDDGKYHVHNTNVHEQYWIANDGIMDLGAIRGTAPLAMRAAEILGVDAELRAKWQELLDNLAPYPMGSDPEAKGLDHNVLAEDVWATGHLGKVAKAFGDEDMWLSPVFPFENWTLETQDPVTDRIVQKLIDLVPSQSRTLEGGFRGSAERSPICSVRAGRADLVPALLASYYAAFKVNPGFQIPVLPNGLALFEGMTAHSIENLGLVTMVLQESLLQSVSPRPGEPEIIRIAPAWPKHWNATFRLLARGGFLVTSSVQDGQIAQVEIHSRLGETCRLRNPWGKPCVVSEVGGQAKVVQGDILRFPTRTGKQYRILPEGQAAPAPRHLAPQPASEPASYQFTLANGVTVSGTLGRRKNEPFKGLQENEDRFIARQRAGKKWGR